VTSWFQRQASGYKNGHDRPLGGYLILLGAYGTGTAALATAAHVLDRKLPTAIKPWDLLQLTVATHKLARLIAKDPITSPLRSPFTTYEGTSAPAELHEEVRGHGLQHSIGELITCPMCLGQWVATALMFGWVVSPAATRLLTATLTAVAGADFLQYTYAALQQSTEDSGRGGGGDAE
jgi:hypothetical protein